MNKKNIPGRVFLTIQYTFLIISILLPGCSEHQSAPPQPGTASKPPIDTLRLFDPKGEPPGGPLIVRQPTVTTKIDNPYDSSYFIITTLDKGFEVDLKNKKQVFESSWAVDKFIHNNRAEIDSNKILLIGNAKLSYKRFKHVIDVIKKYQFYKFQMITK